MKTPYKNIYTVLKTNRFIVIAVLAFSFLSSGLAVWSVFRINNKALNNAFAINTDGSVIPLKWVAQKENLRVAIRIIADLCFGMRVRSTRDANEFVFLYV